MPRWGSGTESSGGDGLGAKALDFVWDFDVGFAILANVDAEDIAGDTDPLDAPCEPGHFVAKCEVVAKCCVT